MRSRDAHQVVRALDVFVIGPAMVVGGLELRARQPLLGTVLTLSGVFCIFGAAYTWAYFEANPRCP